jgi:hypothetical protein
MFICILIFKVLGWQVNTSLFISSMSHSTRCHGTCHSNWRSTHIRSRSGGLPYVRRSHATRAGWWLQREWSSWLRYMNTVVARLESRITPFLGDIHCHMTHKKFFPTSGGYISIHVCCTMHGCYCTGGGLRVYDISIRAGIFKHSIYYALSFLDLNFEFDVWYTMHYLISFWTLISHVTCIVQYASLNFWSGLEFLNIQ